jgi:hypothetical protein
MGGRKIPEDKKVVFPIFFMPLAENIDHGSFFSFSHLNILTLLNKVIQKL